MGASRAVCTSHTYIQAYIRTYRHTYIHTGIRRVKPEGRGLANGLLKHLLLLTPSSRLAPPLAYSKMEVFYFNYGDRLG